MASVRERIATFLFGRRYLGPHDYASLRARYSHHRGAYGWARKWRLAGLILRVEQHVIARLTIRLYPVSRDLNPHWRDANSWMAG